MSIESLLQRAVCTIGPDSSCREVAQLLRDERVGCAVVSEEDRPLGIVTRRVPIVDAAGRLEGVVSLDDLLLLLGGQLHDPAEAVRGELESP